MMPTKMTLEFNGNVQIVDVHVFAEMLKEYIRYVAEDDARRVYETFTEIMSRTTARQLLGLVSNE